MKDKILKIIKSEIFRYLFFGGLTTIVSIGSYAIFSNALSAEGKISPLGVQLANVFSWILAVTFAYITNKLFVFESKSFKPEVIKREAASFGAARLFSLGVVALWLFVLTYLGVNDKIAKVSGQVFVVILNYIFSKLFIFKKDKKEKK
ncbi:MAG: GtrA family protein [Cloacibacillus porcorum]|uniref:GtrA family protein n=1 Tax=Cloacibacillus porcorum TaxID=1197717 RepID=UPI0023F29E10|nr:GtrA family protein [Cloacibacillus porcorum]MCD7875486.1 GtrA family protein [Cloacibacillus porcorum]